jgi:alpha-glucosidase
MVDNAISSTDSLKQWWRGAVTYHIYPRSFQDSNGDGIGDLPGIISRLDYIADLNVDAIWISPFFRSPMKDFGYDVSDYRDVDPLFGNLKDFDALIAGAHQRGLKVMIDQVLSHTSDQHAWFKESRRSNDNPKADWYVWADPKPDGAPPNNWQSVFGGSAWQWEARRKQYYLHNFLSSQPDLNFHTEAVQKQILEDVRFWCERGVDGFRVDACNFHFHDRLLRDNPAVGKDATISSVRKDNPYSMQQHLFDKNQPENLAFLQKLRAVLDEYGAVSLGEVGDENALSLMAQYTADGNKLHMAYSFNLLTDEFSAAHIRKQVEELNTNISAVNGWGCWSLSNHDVARVLTRWGKDNADQRLAKLLLAMLGSLRGSICTYQGEELGLTEADVPFESLQDPYGLAFWPEFKGRDGCRTPIPWYGDSPYGEFSSAKPWLPMPSEHLLAAVNRQEKDENSVLQFYRSFFAWRRANLALKLGDIEFFDAPEPVLLLERRYGSEHILAAFNLGSVPVTITLPKAVMPLAGHEVSGAELNENTLSLSAYGGFFGQSS